MMVGFPNEMPKDLNNTINFPPKKGAVFMGIHITWPQPGSVLYDEAIRNGIIDRDIVDNFVNGRTGYEAHNFWPIYLPKGVTLRQLIHAKKKAYRNFYLRPGWIFQRLKWYLQDPSKILQDVK